MFILLNRGLTSFSKKFQTDLHYLAKGGFWLSLSQIITIGGGLATSVVFAHLLSQTTYGTYQYLLGIGAVLTSFSLTGIGQSILQTAAKKYTGFFAYGMKQSFIYSIGITFASIVGCIYYFYNDNLLLALGCLLIGIFQPLINNFQNIFLYLQGSGQFKKTTLFQSVKTVVVVVVSLLTVYFTQNVLLLLLAYLSVHAITNFFGYLYYRPKSVSSITVEIRDKYMAYAKHTSLRNTISSIAFRSDTILIFTQLGAVELAMYAIANIIPEQVKGSFKNIAALLIPKYVQHENIEISKKSIPKRSLQLFTLLSFITIVYVLCAPAIYSLLFPKYESAVLLSQIAALSFPAFVLLIPSSVLQAQLEERKLHMLTIQSALVLLVLMLLCIPLWGLIGALVAKVFSRYFNLFLSYLYVYR